MAFDELFLLQLGLLKQKQQWRSGAEALVVACFALTGISFLWYNLIGCAAVVALAHGLDPVLRRAPAAG